MYIFVCNFPGFFRYHYFRADNYFLLQWGSDVWSIDWFIFSSPSQPQYYYHKRLLQGPTLYSVAEADVNQQYPVPTVPVQVPLQAQFTPTGIRNVQLVPCLCPVSQEYPDGGDKATTVDNFYANLPYQPPAQNTNAGQNKK